MLRNLIATLVCLVPLSVAAQEAKKPSIPCGPTEEVIQSFIEKGYKIGGMGDTRNVKILALYNIDKKSLAAVTIAQTEGTAISCVLFVADNFNTKPSKLDE